MIHRLLQLLKRLRARPEHTGIGVEGDRIAADREKQVTNGNGYKLFTAKTINGRYLDCLSSHPALLGRYTTSMYQGESDWRPKKIQNTKPMNIRLKFVNNRKL